MLKDIFRNPVWSTSSFGSAPHTTPIELASLGAHLIQCTRERVSLVALRHAAEIVRGFAAARIISVSAMLTLVGCVGFHFS